MSLVYWLPMVSDELKNQGLSNATPVNNGTTVGTAGKLGKCRDFSGNAQYIDTGYKESFGTGDFTISLWAKLNVTSGKSYQPIISNKTTAAVSVGVSIYYNQSQNKFLWSTADGSASTEIWTANTFSASTINGKWMHIVMVRDSSDPKKGYFYIDGVRQDLASVPAIRNVTNTTYNLMIGDIANHGHTGYIWTGSISDVRIYDEVLSPKQIKLLSQGLVLHYTLGDPFIEGTTNLITSEDCLSSTCFNGATLKYGYGTNSDMYKTVTTFDGKKGTKVYMGTNGNSAYPYVYINNMYTSNGTNSPAYKTLSFDYYTTISTSISPYKLGSGSGTATYKVVNDTVKTGTGTNSVVIPVKPNTWNHIEVTFHGTTDADAQWGYIQNRPTHTSDTSNFWFFANMQLEAKDHATGYTKYGTSRSETTVYDVSGYCNNGTINGALTTSNNTPKYRFATIFDGNTASIKIPFNDMIKDKNYTISVWTYKSQIGTKNYQTILGGPSGFELEARSSSNTSPLFRIHNWGGDTTPYEFDKWYHFCFVHTDTDSKLYINGELKITGTSVNVPTGNYFIGAWNTATAQNYDGLMSDFRIYTTALSADDILELYNTPVHLTANGALLTSGELTEV